MKTKFAAEAPITPKNQPGWFEDPGSPGSRGTNALLAGYRALHSDNEDAEKALNPHAGRPELPDGTRFERVHI